MTDPGSLRHLIETSVRQRHETEYERFAAASLVLAFNQVAPDEARLTTPSSDSLEIRSSKGVLASRETLMVVDHFTRAVAALGREIHSPSAPFVQLSPADYRKAAVYLDVHGAGSTIVLRPERPSLLMDEQPVDRLAAQALDRLTNLLPESAEDQRAVDAAMGARITSRRALREVAEVATRLGGVQVALHRRNSVVDAALSTDQAEAIRDQLDFDDTQLDTIRREGVLDGARSRRRLFYLEVSPTETIEGVIDESLVDEVFAHLTERVSATIQRTRHTSRAGIVGRPAYRLTGLQPADDELSM